MTGEHHLAAGVCVSACLTTSLIYFKDASIVPIVGTTVATIVGSLFPDIDNITLANHCALA